MCMDVCTFRKVVLLYQSSEWEAAFFSYSEALLGGSLINGYVFIDVLSFFRVLFSNLEWISMKDFGKHQENW